MSEIIEVTTLFKNGGPPIPKSFKWGSRIYNIRKINLFHTIKKGATRILVFNVSDDGGDRTLIFDTLTLRWSLE